MGEVDCLNMGGLGYLILSEGSNSLVERKEEGQAGEGTNGFAFTRAGTKLKGSPWVFSHVRTGIHVEVLPKDLAEIEANWCLSPLLDPEFSKAEAPPMHLSVPRARRREGTVAKQSCVTLTWKERQDLGCYAARWL